MKNTTQIDWVRNYLEKKGKSGSLMKHIESYLKTARKWVHGEVITKYGQSLGYEGESARRKLRLLVEKGIVETEPRKGKRANSNWYRYVRAV